MNRCKVICHMMTSIDGKIDGNYMDENGCNVSGTYYDTKIWEFGNANATGRTTAQMYFANANVDYSKYVNAEIDFSDNIIKSDYYWIVFDRKGSCNWDTNKITYGGKTANVVMVLTKQVSVEYLAHLKSLNISYIIAGNEDIDFNIALSKLKEKFEINTLVLTGGATINGAFYKNDVIDEISVVIAPYIEGNHELKGMIESEVFKNTIYKFKMIKVLDDGSIHLEYQKIK